MNRLEINPNNEKYYSKEFMQGYKCGIRCQSHEDMKVLEQIRVELHATAEMHEDGDYYLRDEWIDEYFDKYK